MTELFLIVTSNEAELNVSRRSFSECLIDSSDTINLTMAQYLQRKSDRFFLAEFFRRRVFFIFSHTHATIRNKIIHKKGSLVKNCRLEWRRRLHMDMPEKSASSTQMCGKKESTGGRRRELSECAISTIL